MITQRRKAGYLAMDHRESPGVSEADMHKNAPELKVTAGRGLYETNIVHCGHCQKGLVVHPLLMIDLPYCHKCDAHICEACKTTMVVTGECLPFSKIVDIVQEAALKGLPPPINLERIHG